MGADGGQPLPALDDASTNLQASRVAHDDVYSFGGERSEYTLAPTTILASPAVSTSGSFVSFLLCVLFALLLLLNAIVAYMYFYQHAKRRTATPPPPSLNLSEDDPAMEPFVARPLVCSYHCVVEDPSEVVLPPDGLCNFLFFNLPDTRAYTTWDIGPCGSKVTGAAKAAAQTKFGLAVHASRANDTDVDLRLESGVFAFARQWDANVRHHGVNYLRGNTAKLLRNFKHHLAVLKRFRTLQEHFKRHTGHLLKRNYILLGVQVIFDNFAAERPRIASFIKTLYTEYPLDLLVINTHFWTWEPRCLVIGPTMLHSKANLSEPTIANTTDLLHDVAVPDKIAVLLSFSAAVIGFLMPVAWDQSLRYGSGCLEAQLYPTTSLCHGDVDPPEDEQLSVVQLSRKLAADKNLMLAWDSKQTIQIKVKHVYDSYRRERFGWLTDNVERDDALAKCAALNFTFLRYVKAFMA